MGADTKHQSDSYGSGTHKETEASDSLRAKYLGTEMKVKLFNWVAKFVKTHNLCLNPKCQYIAVGKKSYCNLYLFSFFDIAILIIVTVNYECVSLEL